MEAVLGIAPLRASMVCTFESLYQGLVYILLVAAVSEVKFHSVRQVATYFLCWRVLRAILTASPGIVPLVSVVSNEPPEVCPAERALPLEVLR